MVRAGSPVFGRPTVRLLGTPDGRPAPRQTDIDLADGPDGLLRSLPPGGPLPEHALDTAGV